MMRYQKSILILTLLAGAFTACADKDAAPAQEEVPAFGESYLRQLQPRDSVLIADQLRYGFRIQGAIDGELFQPLPEKPALPGIRVIGEWEIATLGTRSEGGLEVHDLDAHIRLTSFDAGSYELPELGVVIGHDDDEADTLRFEGKTIDFVNCAVDTTKFTPENLHIPPTAIVRFPWTAAEKRRVAAWSAAGVVLLGLLILGIWWLLRRRRKALEAAIPDPPHIRALRKIDAYRSDAYWKPEKQKAFYSGITDALKEYIGSRYAFDAPEMTSGEVLQHLRKETDLDKDLRDGLGHLFEVADYVKFARHTADDAENAGVVPFAVGFVTRTYQEVLEKEAAESNNGKEAAQ